MAIMYFISHFCKLCGDSFEIVKNEEADVYGICDNCCIEFIDKIKDEINRFDGKIGFFKKRKLNPIQKIAYKHYKDILWIKNHEQKMIENRDAIRRKL